MAAGVLSKPGTQYGPCEVDCKHIDCAATRKQAETDCAKCALVIGYETRFYRLPDGALVHAECEELAMEAAG